MNFVRAFLQDLIIREFVRIPKSASLLLFIAGFVLLAIQILGVRVLGPWLGTAIPVWASVIATMLTGSALGYYGGGALADRTRSKHVVMILVLSGVFFILTIPFIRGVVPYLLEALPYTVALFLSVSLVLLSPSVCVSALITYVIRLFVETLASIGQVHGDLYAIATFGSICAVFLTSYYLIPSFTIPHILYGLGVLLGISGLIYIRSSRF